MYALNWCRWPNAQSLCRRYNPTKFLGLYIDEHLSWKQHIDHCKNKMFQNSSNEENYGRLLIFPHIDEDWRYCEKLCCCATAEWMTNIYYLYLCLCWVPLPSPEGYRLCLEWHPRKYKNFEICIDYIIPYCIPNIYMYTFWIKYLLTYLLNTITGNAYSDP